MINKIKSKIINFVFKTNVSNFEFSNDKFIFAFIKILSDQMEKSSRSAIPIGVFSHTKDC